LPGMRSLKTRRCVYEHHSGYIGVVGAVICHVGEGIHAIEINIGLVGESSTVRNPRNAVVRYHAIREISPNMTNSPQFASQLAPAEIQSP